MMGPSHRAAAAPLGIGLMLSVPWGSARPFAELVGRVIGDFIGYFFGQSAGAWVAGLVFAVVYVLVECVVHLLLGLMVVAVAKINDLDHPRFKGKLHPGAWAVRFTAQVGYAIRLPKDVYRLDLHRGPSHCLEWCALVGASAGFLTSRLPPLAPWAPWWGLAVFLGTASHVLLDAMTPAGVPTSAIYNAIVHREVWRRHAFTWKWSDVPVWAPCVLAATEPWQPATTLAAVPGLGRPVAAGVAGVTDEVAEDVGEQPLGPVGLLAYVFSPGVRATTALRVGLHRFVVPVPRIGVMPVDEKATSECDPGLVKTDSGAEHMLVIPFLWFSALTVLLAGVGWLGPIVWWLTS